MVMPGNLHVNTEQSVFPKTFQMSCLPNGEAEISLHNQAPYQFSNGRCRSLGFDGSSARPCYDEKCGEKNISGMSSNSTENQSANSQPDIVCLSGPHGYMIQIPVMQLAIVVPCFICN